MKKIIKQIFVASGPVIIERGEVLLNKHGSDKFWKFLGGKVEIQDLKNPEVSLETTCIREVKEENGFDIEIIRPLKPMMLPKPGSKDVYVVLIHFLAKRKGKLKLGEDIDDYRKFDIKKIIQGKYKEKFAPNVAPVLKDYLKKQMGK